MSRKCIVVLLAYQLESVVMLSLSPKVGEERWLKMANDSVEQLK